MQAQTLRLRERRNLTEIVSHAFNFYGRDWRGFVTIGAGTIPLSIVATVVLAQIDDELTYWLANAAFFIPLIAVTAVVESAIIRHLLDIDEGRESDEAQAYKAAFAHMGDVLIAVFKAVAATLLLAITIIGLPAAIERGIRWLFVPQSVMIDGQTRSTALTYCVELSKGNWWRTFGRLLFVGLLVAIIAGISTSLALGAPVVLYAVVSAIVGAFTTPLYSIAKTLMYFDLKLRRAEDTPA